VHASWLNQVDIYFSIIQRKALMPNDFRSLSDLEQRLWVSKGTTRVSLDLFSGGLPGAICAG